MPTLRHVYSQFLLYQTDIVQVPHPRKPEELAEIVKARNQILARIPLPPNPPDNPLVPISLPSTMSLHEFLSSASAVRLSICHGTVKFFNRFNLRLLELGKRLSTRICPPHISVTYAQSWELSCLAQCYDKLVSRTRRTRLHVFPRVQV